MNKRFWSLALTAALVAGVFAVLPASAQEAPAVAIPATVQIDDPVGDANGLNDQDNAYNVPPLVGEGDYVGPADVGTATDIMKVWFTNTASDVSLNIQLEGDPSLLAYDTYFRFSTNVGEGSVATDALRGCLQWVASVNGAAGAYNGPTEGNLTDKCNVGEPVLGPLAISAAEAGFVITVTFPRSYSPLLANGSSLTAPFGVSRVLYADGLPPSPAAGSTAAFVTMDNTKRGTDYTLSSGGPAVTPEPSPTVEPPGKADPPGKGKKNGCKKGKGKKKGACPGKKPPKPSTPPAPPGPPTCAPYVPGEAGKGAPTSVVTADFTEEKPLEVAITAPSTVDDPFYVFQNIQVGAGAEPVGLYARYEFPTEEDHDIYLDYASGTEAARAGGFNPAPFVPTTTIPGVVTFGTDGTGAGGHSEQGAEQLDGIKTSPCGGYTLEMQSYLSAGGEMVLKLWLGEIQNEPAADGGSLTWFYGLLGL